MTGTSEPRSCMYYPDCDKETVGRCSGCERHICADDMIRHEAQCKGGRVTGYVCTRCKHPRDHHSDLAFENDHLGCCLELNKRGGNCGCPRFADPLASYRIAQEVRT